MPYIDLLTQYDYEKLTNDDLRELKKLIPELKETICDSREWLKNNINIITNERAIDIIKNKVFAGQITIKLYKVNTILNDGEVIKKIESKEFKFNSVDEKENGDISIYSTVRISENSYLIRLRYDNGIRKLYGNKIIDIRHIDVIYHLTGKVLEVRTDVKKAKKIVDFLENKLRIGNIEAIRVLTKHKNIEEFSAALGGHFKKMTSNTALQIETLTKEDISSLGELVLALDDYLINGDIQSFTDKLEMLKFDNQLTFTQAFLAGCGQIGISTDNSINSDLKNQPLYKSLSKYLKNENGYIVFRINEDSNEATIRLSTKMDTNTIQFVSSVTEKEIDVVVRNITDGMQLLSIDINELKELDEEIKKYITNPNIIAIRPEYLVENFNLDQDTVKRIIGGYISSGKVIEKYEFISPDTYEVIKEYKSIEEMRQDIDFIMDNVDSNYSFIEDDKEFFYEYSEFINIKYNLIKKNINDSKCINTQIISQQLEFQLNTDIKQERKQERRIFDKMKYIASLI